MVRQFAKIDIQPEVRATDNNQFPDKVRKGVPGVLSGWIADYPGCRELPVPLYGPNGKTVTTTARTRQLRQPGVRRAVLRTRLMEDGPDEAGGDRPAWCRWQQDAPWSFGYRHSSGAAQVITAPVDDATTGATRCLIDRAAAQVRRPGTSWSGGWRLLALVGVVAGLRLAQPLNVTNARGAEGGGLTGCRSSCCVGLLRRALVLVG